MPEDRPAGIANLGNTCYMNAALQCGVLACKPLVKYFLSDEYLQDLTVVSVGSLSKAIAWLADEVRNPDNRNTIYPTIVKAAIDEKIPRFKGTDQNDCSEFLIQLLDQLHVELGVRSFHGYATRSNSLSLLTRSASSLAAMNGSISGKSIAAINWPAKAEQWWSAHRKKDDSVVRRLYEGAIRAVMTCTVCGGISARFETFTSLILPVGSDGDVPSPTAQFDLRDLLLELLKPEMIEGIDCDVCRRKRTFNRTIDLWRLPPFLILTIGRFSFDYATGRKMNNFVDYPAGLSLEEFVPSEAPLQDISTYELYGVIEHEGTLNRGHYTAMVKTSASGWANANDARVSLVTGNIVTRNAYMLFYKWAGEQPLDVSSLD